MNILSISDQYRNRLGEVEKSIDFQKSRYNMLYKTIRRKRDYPILGWLFIWDRLVVLEHRFEMERLILDMLEDYRNVLLNKLKTIEDEG